MAGTSGLVIEESKEQLEGMLKKEKNLKMQQRLQVLYLMQSEKMPINKIGVSMGKHRATIHRWLEQYQSGGIAEMLSIKKPTGRPRKIPQWAEKSLEKQLEKPEGFKSYGQIQRWLETTLGITAAYRTVHELTRCRLKAKLKVGQKPSPKQDREKIEAFKKTSEPI